MGGGEDPRDPRAETDAERHSVPVDPEGASTVLASLLGRFPEAMVAAIDGSGIAIPVPESVPLTDRHTSVDSTFDLVTVDDRAVIVNLYARARSSGLARGQVHLDDDSAYAVTVHAVDCRVAHGAIIVIVADRLEDGSGAENEWLLPHLPARLARAHKDGAATFTSIDAALTEILGWQADQLVGRRALEIVHPDDRDTAIANWVEMLTTPGLGRRVRLRHQHRDGHWVWLEITNRNRLDDPVHGDVVAEMVDISDEMAAHEALESREQLLHELAQTVPLGLFHSDAEGRIIFANERLSAFLRAERISTIDDVIVAIDPSDRSAVEEAVLKAVAGGGDGDLEVRIQSPGSVRYGQLRLRAPEQATAGFSGFIGCLEDVTEAVLMRRRLEVQANYDPLTECRNRSSTMAAISSRINSLNPSDSEGLALLYIDLDRFKPVNDTYGHAVGDQVLMIAAKRLNGTIRDGDIVGRIGGDEFLVICPTVGSAANALQIAESISARLCGPARAGSCQVEVCASTGVSWTCDPQVDVEQLVEAADAAMYLSKRVGECRPILADAIPRRPHVLTLRPS
jgi:diguanylate cyclase (GGDEF)-like protein/PAS domain S-box-containing protein